MVLIHLLSLNQEFQRQAFKMRPLRTLENEAWPCRPSGEEGTRLSSSSVHLAERILDLDSSIEESDLKKAKEMALVPLLQQLGDGQQTNGLALCPEEGAVGHYKKRAALCDQQLGNRPHIDI